MNMDDKERQEWDAKYEAEGKTAALYGIASGLELRKIKFFEAGSEETNCFVADIYKKGKKVGQANNDGHGGDTLARISDMTDQDYKLLTRWADDQFEAWLKAKEVAKMDKWILKNVVRNAALGLKSAVVRDNQSVRVIPTKLTTVEAFKASNEKYLGLQIEIKP